MLLYQIITDAMYGEGFADKVKEVSKNLGINPNWLMALMRFESSLKTEAVNKYSNATGLIQFMPKTAIGLGTTVEALKNMRYWQQLNYVEKYYWPYRKKIKDEVDLYLVTFYPYALNKPESYILGSQVSSGMARTIAKQNPVFDLNKDFRVSLGELKIKARNLIFKDLYKTTPSTRASTTTSVAPAPTPPKEEKKKSNKTLWLIGGIAAFTGGALIMNNQSKNKS